jgi:hypothetical protein
MKEPEAHVNSPLQTRAEQDPVFAEEMWRFRHPEEGGEKLTLEAILVEVPLRYGITVGSLDTLSRFYRWLKLKRDFAAKRDAITQIKEEMAKDPSIAPEQIERAGRVMFLADSYVEKNAKVFASMMKIGQTDKSLDQRDKQLRQRDREISQREKLVEQAERRVRLLEAKAAKADEASKVMGDGSLSEEERAARMKEIFGF